MVGKQYKTKSQPMESQRLNVGEGQGNSPLKFHQPVYQQGTNNLPASL